MRSPISSPSTPSTPILRGFTASALAGVLAVAATGLAPLAAPAVTGVHAQVTAERHVPGSGSAAAGLADPLDRAPLTGVPRVFDERGAPVLQAHRAGATKPVVDGLLDEPVWASADVAADFVQFQPDEGAPASQPTEARVVYGEDALYVGLRAWDSAADSIVGQLSRRDQRQYSDWLGVLIDSYHDRRTAFHFMVNPRGVKVDIYHFDDTSEDAGWDAVWDVATSVDERGWTAEFRIPYSQIRFREAEEQTWGVNFHRDIARHDEVSVWAPTLRSESALVSRFGELRGLRGIEAPRRLEVMPYTLARVRRQPGDAANPFHEATETTGTVGADVKIGVTGELTLDATINPDFGQVEADPAQVNLSAFETFLPERRPFFVEGSNLFDFSLALGDGDDATESLFYSRRIGRAPQGSPSAPGGYADTPENTTILGAVKLSGKTSGGWSVGTLAAVTGQQDARVSLPGESVTETLVEPRTTYALTRVSRDFRDGNSAVGAIATGVMRDAGAADALGIHRTAWTGGVDFRHRFADGNYQTSGYVLGSHVRGSTDALLATQTSSARWFQRPDADHVELDPTRTSLSGVSASASLGKIAGGSWRWGTGAQTRSPGFEANDMGYQREADFATGFLYAGYDQSSPQGPFRRWRLNTNVYTSVTWGLERQGSGGNVNGSFQLANFWSGYGGVNYNASGLSSGALRGGPLLRTDPRLGGWAGLNTDGRKAVRLNLNTNWGVRPESDSWNLNLSPSATWRPSARASVTLGSFVNRNVNDQQWVGRREAGGEDRWIFGRIDQTTVGITGRVDYAFTPALSLQLYAQPYVSSGSYGDFKQVVDPRAEAYADRLASVPAVLGDDGTYRADLDGDGTDESWRNPDFDFRQFRSNAVLRWEYRPGSTLYAVWSQGRNHALGDGRFDFRGGLDDLFGAPADDIFMLKVTYWINP